MICPPASTAQSQKAQAKFEKEEHVVEMLKQGKTTLEIYGFDKLIEKLEAM